VGLLIKEKNQTYVSFFSLLIACYRIYQKLGGQLAVRLNTILGYPYLLLVVMDLAPDLALQIQSEIELRLLDDLDCNRLARRVFHFRHRSGPHRTPPKHRRSLPAPSLHDGCHFSVQKLTLSKLPQQSLRRAQRYREFRRSKEKKMAEKDKTVV
jgi:hypothetical protein